MIDETHDVGLRSWVESAGRAGTDFTIQNLPLGVFRRESAAAPRLGVAIGDEVLDLSRCVERGLLDDVPDGVRAACRAPALNPLMALGRAAVSALRSRVSRLLRAGQKPPADAASLLAPASEVELLVPAEIGDYTDFYASIYHATNVGSMFRPDNPLLPNYRHVPIAYHGRGSSIVASGTSIRRPCGQTKAPDAPAPSFGPTRRLDYELEVGVLIGRGNELGRPVAIADAHDHVLGLCLVNDWSARDVQAWEYQPLGPFLSKSFATTISPWVVTLDALAPFRCPAFERGPDDPAPLPYLDDPHDREQGGFDITVEALLRSRRMADEGIEPHRLGRGTFRDMYWTVAQMVAHHTSNGCNLRPGDLLASGTVSGPDEGSLGCLLEITRRGERTVKLPTGEERGFLADGDEVILRAYCVRDGFARIGFGECRGAVAPA